jgi:hypothetical protein
VLDCTIHRGHGAHRKGGKLPLFYLRAVLGNSLGLFRVYFTEQGIGDALIKCYKEIHPAAQFGKDVHRDLKTYGVGEKGSSVYTCLK